MTVAALSAYKAAARDWYASVIDDAELDVPASYVAQFAPYPVASSQDVEFADGPAPWKHEPAEVSVDRGGHYLRKGDGEVTRDPWAMARALKKLHPGPWRDVAFLLAGLADLPRRTRDRLTTARALLYQGLIPHLGPRAAARQILAWEDELQAPHRLMGRWRVEAMIRTCLRAKHYLPQPFCSAIPGRSIRS